MSLTDDKWLTGIAKRAAELEGDEPAQASPPTGSPILRLPVQPPGLRDTNPYQGESVPPRRQVGGK